MDKNRKLRRYTRKDYTQVVDFPVEIVGRDGVVRRYSFEDSVRLYQRRIASANMRYEDADIVDAEVEHCQRRIEQLRRSYFTRYGWSAIRVADGPGVLSGDLAGEVAAFLRRCIEPSDHDPEGLDFAWLDTGRHCSVYSVRRAGVAAEAEVEGAGGDQYLLYVYHFEQSGSSPVREAFFEFLKVLQGVRRSSDAVEALVAFHHTADCGLVLTGRSGSVGIRAPLDDDGHQAGDFSWLDAAEERPDALREGMALLRQGQREDALRCFVEAYHDNHWRRAAYVGAAVVADQLGAHGDAETAALMGAHYFPHDSLFAFHVAVSRLRRGDVDGARQALSRPTERDGASFSLTLVGALVELRAGRMHRGRRMLARARKLADRDEHDLYGALRRVRAQLAARSLLRASALIFVAACLVAILAGWVWATVPMLLGVAALPLIDASWRRQFARLLAAPPHRGLRLANPNEMGGAGEGGAALQ